MINSITNAVKVINCFSIEQPEVGVSDLSIKLEMNKSTVHHIVKALHNEGVLVRTPSRKYRLGSRLLGWGNLVTEQYKSFFNATPYIDNLVKLTNEVVHLAVRENNEVSYLAKIEPKTPVRIKTTIGDRNPLYCTALGKVLLASNIDKDLGMINDLILIPLTSQTITNHERLIDELRKINEQGYAIDDEEFEIGLFCIAVPIKDFMGNVVCAISISGPEYRIKENKDHLIKKLLLTASKISTFCDL
ncbi:IclR family transcriptional regulator [Anaerobacillus isosaccharinicus]|uniref:IclR family transcriptional regulator n=1 Tax=Anaerobacillus isosaccharinicus TaxID=1532552 RepID=A0A1S2M9L1_9BACI|nr:IclR family transcriptional regulator [Anaerobacillus isosaccharinicus]MBA5587187.1 IclR family transcriptional regulator [Anaerobacillus isosaccharinicus]QOY34617.1 IclR family transcriptional regulator [Anaerobacillus isosaccharinicus]